LPKDTSPRNQRPLILLYNPRTAKPGYQRLPLSLLQLGTRLEPRFPYALIDGNLDQERDGAEAVIAAVRRQEVRYLGVTIMPGPQLQQAVRDLRRIKAACPSLSIIVGGYFPSLHPHTCATDPDVDYVVLGPGEDTLPELLEALEAGGTPLEVPGLAFVHQGQVVQTAPREPRHPQSLPRLPYHKVPVERYLAKTFLGTRTLSHHSSYGCPFHCNFCAVAKVAQGQWLAEGAGRLGELAQFLVNRWQINALEFHDNDFFVSESRVATFCEELLTRGLKLSWWGEGRIDTLLHFSSDTWALMRASGLKMVFMGAESGDDQVLQLMNKGGSHSTESTLKLAARARKYGIIPEFSFVLGNPGDSGAGLVRTLEFIREVKETNPQAEIILYRYDPVPLAGDLWQGAQARGFRFPQTLEEWASPHWLKVQRRRRADLPWLSQRNQQLLADFETVINAYFPTSTDVRLHRGPWRLFLRALSGWRYQRRFYRWPWELRALQSLIRYQRPETSGF
jgi:anaerobic magnesium-protoporphyrin IX monomethyl ester cyclase